VSVDHFAKRDGFDDFDLIAPHIKMPSHFQQATCFEAHGHGAVFAIGDLLAGMEHEIAGGFCGVRRELPNNLDGFFFPDTEGLLGIALDVEGWIASKALLCDRDILDLGKDEMMARSLASLLGAAANQIMPVAI